MPYAFNGKISTSPIAGGVVISDSEYEQALAGVTDRSDVKQVSIVGGIFSLVAASMPIETTLALADATTLPSITGGARPPVNTGLARHPDGGWIIGDDGRFVGGDNTRDAGVIHYSDNFEQITRTTWADLGVGSNTFSAQGVAVDQSDYSVYAVAKDVTNTATVIVQVSLDDWSLIRTIDALPDTNGLAVDSDRRHLLTFDDVGVLRRLSMDDGEVVGQYNRLVVPSPDMLHYLGGGKVLITYGDNRTNGKILQADISTGTLIRERLFTATGADAIEGVVVHEGVLYLCNDANWHPGDPELNRVLQYDVGGIFS